MRQYRWHIHLHRTWRESLINTIDEPVTVLQCDSSSVKFVALETGRVVIERTPERGLLIDRTSGRGLLIDRLLTVDDPVLTCHLGEN